MFDYQAGERYKLTLIMVGLAGLMGGIFITILLGVGSEPPRQRPKRPQSAYSPDTGVQMGGSGGPVTGAQIPNTPSAPAVTDAQAATDFVRQFVNAAFDMNSASASQSQAAAMNMMDPTTAQGYRQNIWTPEVEQLVQENGLKSQFIPAKISTGQQNPDGSIVVFVEGQQSLVTAEGQQQDKAVSMEYLVHRGPDGFKIAGITDHAH